MRITVRSGVLFKLILTIFTILFYWKIKIDLHNHYADCACVLLLSTFVWLNQSL
jgi:hypothetical protein